MRVGCGVTEVFYSIGAVGVGCGVTEEIFYSIGAVRVGCGVTEGIL